ncbi:hypothetical protein RQP53_11995 [Paucibacter sp. APW11]|uniref:Uncharacterized protein n=1 Tax=Roseateles aquae TaxID=3077235 RepID=A0ABU3PBP6_9BURK|nr:hypothetical protein [Paucibacter sp. APW11]MDT8999987.1 hypothetical protein [Paucibacter sp. APW11]
MTRRFSFDLFRLNIEDADDLFADSNLLRIRTNDDITEVLRTAADPEQDQIQKTRSAVFKWSIREYRDLSSSYPERPLLHVVLARSVLERDGLIVTDDGMASGTSSLNPPLASTAVCLFDLSRHLVAVEHTGDLAPTTWKDFFEKILTTSARRLDRWSSISLEPVPEQNGIVGLFLSFERITRMRVTLRIPNPELNRYTKQLYEDLSNSGIREMTQDMKNPNGLSKAEEARPFASAVLAEQGYKKGDVQFEGLRNGTFEQASSGATAARGSVRGLRDFVRGLHANAKAKEAQRILSAITAEIDRIHPIPGVDEQ